MREDYKRVIRFIAAGVTNTIFGYCVYVGFIFLAAPIWLAIIGSLVAGVLFNYMTYGGFVFRLQSRLHFVLFSGFYGLLAFVNYSLLTFLLSLQFTPYFAQLLLLPPLALFAYVGMNWGVFGAWTSRFDLQQKSRNYEK